MHAYYDDSPGSFTMARSSTKNSCTTDLHGQYSALRPQHAHPLQQQRPDAACVLEGRQALRAAGRAAAPGGRRRGGPNMSPLRPHGPGRLWRAQPPFRHETCSASRGYEGAKASQHVNQHVTVLFPQTKPAPDAPVRQKAMLLLYSAEVAWELRLDAAQSLMYEPAIHD